jgi:CBS domain-containing protein
VMLTDEHSDNVPSIKRFRQPHAIEFGVNDDPVAHSARLTNGFLLQAETRRPTIAYIHALGGSDESADLIANRTEIYSLSEEATVHEAAKYFLDRGVRAAGVCDSSGALVGVVSQADVSDKVAAENKCPAWMRVSEIMTRWLVTVSPEETLEDCSRLMEQNGIFHLLIVDARKGFRGMISVTDLLQLVASDEKARADMLEALIFPQR